MLKKLENILLEAKKRPPVKMVIASAHDLHVLESVKMAISNHLIEPILVGRFQDIKKYAAEINLDISSFDIIESTDDLDTGLKAAQCVKDKRADIIMKGLIPSNIFLKSIIELEKSLGNNCMMSHIALVQVMGYHKLLTISDVAMNIRPNVDEKKAIILNALKVLHKLGNDLPKVAILGPYEKPNLKIQSTMDAQKLVEMYKNGIISGCFLEGPLALDNAISKESAFIKGIHGHVAGDADVLICHDLDSGNVLYKSLVFLAGAQTAAIIAGASVPVVLTSRSDDALNKLYSIALAKLLI
jgi:phosphate butyryltransferase